jgi:hypothetical protein
MPAALNAAAAARAKTKVYVLQSVVRARVSVEITDKGALKDEPRRSGCVGQASDDG